MAFPNGWRRKCELVIQHSQVVSGCTDFPVLIHKDSLPSEIFDADGNYPAINGGGDIRFSSDSTGNTQIPCEIESFVTDNNPANGKAAIWAKQTISSSTNTSIWVWYNKPGETQPAEDSAYGKESVWDSNFKLVQHMNQDPSGSSPQMIDSTSNDNDGTSGGTMLTEDQVVGKIDGSLDFDGGDDCIDMGSSASLDITTDKITIAAWIKFISTYDSGRSEEATLVSMENKIECRWEDIDGKLWVGLSTGGWGALKSVQTSWTAGNWYHIVTTYNGTNRYLYINGTLDNSMADTGNLDIASSNLTTSYSGTLLDNKGPFDGIIDEICISDVARTAGWIETEYNNQNSPSTFIIEGSPETVGWTGKFMGITNPAKIMGISVANIAKVNGI